jgi:hypothetical protein
MLQSDNMERVMLTSISVADFSRHDAREQSHSLGQVHACAESALKANKLKHNDLIEILAFLPGAVMWQGICGLAPKYDFAHILRQPRQRKKARQGDVFCPCVQEARFGKLSWALLTVFM